MIPADAVRVFYDEQGRLIGYLTARITWKTDPSFKLQYPDTSPPTPPVVSPGMGPPDSE